MAKMSSLESLFVNSYFDYLLHRIAGLERLIRRAVRGEPGRILEVGCGSGITTKIIAKRFPHSEITAIDIDESQIARADKRLLGEKVHFKLGDATSLQFPDNSFDACFASYAFHHIPCFPQALREIRRVLTEGARLYVVEVPFSLENFLLLKRGRHHEESCDPADTPKGLFTRGKLLSEIRRAGFKVTYLEGLTHVHLVCVRE
jgi:ubiquinone/menaquinone biosynthesis C-methylase UbiE